MSCTKCFMGYMLNEGNTTCVVDEAAKPCAAGYFLDSTTSKCVACAKGCAQCTSATMCYQCHKDVTWKTSETTVCQFECETACIDGANGVYKCTEPTTEGAKKAPNACMLGWNYNGFSM